MSPSNYFHPLTRYYRLAQPLLVDVQVHVVLDGKLNLTDAVVCPDSLHSMLCMETCRETLHGWIIGTVSPHGLNVEVFPTTLIGRHLLISVDWGLTPALRRILDTVSGSFPGLWMQE